MDDRNRNAIENERTRVFKKWMIAEDLKDDCGDDGDLLEMVWFNKKSCRLVVDILRGYSYMWNIQLLGDIVWDALNQELTTRELKHLCNLAS